MTNAQTISELDKLVQRALKGDENAKRQLAAINEVLRRYD